MAAKIKKGDKVVVLAGRDKGRSGEVISVSPSEGRALVRGVKESATVNRWLVGVKLGAIFLFLLLAGPKVDATNWTPFLPYGVAGISAGASIDWSQWGHLNWMFGIVTSMDFGDVKRAPPCNEVFAVWGLAQISGEGCRDRRQRGIGLNTGSSAWTRE